MSSAFTDYVIDQQDAAAGVFTTEQKEAVASLMAENARLRQALRDVYASAPLASASLKIARDALLAS